MKKVVGVFLGGMVLLLFSFAFANEELQIKDKEVGIYFCTKDLDAIASSAIVSDKNGPVSDSILVNKYLNNAAHTFLRHCFMLLAYEINPGVQKTEGGYNRFTWLTILQPIDSAGYGVTPGNNGIVRSEAWLSDKEKRDKFTVSCAPIMKEFDVVSVNASATEDKEQTILNEWDELINRMKMEAKKEKYSVTDHNCCNVAYHSIRNNKKFKYSAVDIRGFNLCGMGITVSKDDSLLDYVMASGIKSGVGTTTWLFGMAANVVEFPSSSESLKTPVEGEQREL